MYPNLHRLNCCCCLRGVLLAFVVVAAAGGSNTAFGIGTEPCWVPHIESFVPFVRYIDTDFGNAAVGIAVCGVGVC